MTAIARMALLDLRTVAAYRSQGLLVFVVMVVVDVHNPVGLVPALAVGLAPFIAVQPFVVAEKAGLQTLYAVLPLPRRSVVLGHYAWAVASFLATTTVGTATAALMARLGHEPFDARTFATLLTVSWTVFAVNIAIQLPLLIRFGYARISVLGTTIPLAFIMLAAYKLHLTLAGIQHWLPLLAATGAAAVVLSAALTALHRPA